MRNDLHANLTVRIFTDRKCFGPGVAELLRRVRELHSLRAAAMSMNMAYSKAWTGPGAPRRRGWASSCSGPPRAGGTAAARC